MASQDVYRPTQRLAKPTRQQQNEQANDFGWGGAHASEHLERTVKALPREPSPTDFVDEFGKGGPHGSSYGTTREVFRERSYVSTSAGPPKAAYAPAVDRGRDVPEGTQPFVPFTQQRPLEDQTWPPFQQPQNATQQRAKEGHLPLLGHWDTKRRQEDEFPLYTYDARYDRGSVLNGGGAKPNSRRPRS